MENETKSTNIAFIFQIITNIEMISFIHTFMTSFALELRKYTILYILKCVSFINNLRPDNMEMLILYIYELF